VLNELYQIATMLEGQGLQALPVHPSLEPMKNAPLMVARLSAGGQPARLEVLNGEIAETISRVKHSSSGSSFPGVNLPLPLWDLTDAPTAESAKYLNELVGMLAKRDSSAQQISMAARALYSLGRPAQFKQRQQADFKKSVSELVNWLRDVFREAPDEVGNLKLLLDLVGEAPIPLQTFASFLANQIVSDLSDVGRVHCPMALDLLFGTLDWKERNEPLGSPPYFQKKSKRDQGKDGPRKQFVYLELADEDTRVGMQSTDIFSPYVPWRSVLRLEPARKQLANLLTSRRDDKESIRLPAGLAC